jgi:hypothetical protein
MHTFAAVTYDAVNDRLIIASYPGHLEPGRFTDAMAHLWSKIRRHPTCRTETWLYDATADAWSAVPGAELPFSCDMNYNLHYDVVHDLLLLVAGEPTAIWALKLV